MPQYPAWAPIGPSRRDPKPMAHAMTPAIPPASTRTGITPARLGPALLAATLVLPWQMPALAAPMGSTNQGLAAPVSQPPGQATSLPEVYSDLYVLGPGDGLTLIFLDPEARSVGGPFSILPDGTTTLGLIGTVQLNGLTIGQATRWLTSLYGRQLVRPQLTLSLTNPRPVKVTVLGEVSRPGLYPLETFSTPVNAIQTAGGITLNSDIRRVLLRRLAGPDGSQKQTILDLSQLYKFGNQRQNPILFDGDTLVVGRTENPPSDEVLQIGATNLAPASINVTILGEVKSPGSISLPANTPLVEAIQRAGGTRKWRANKNSVELVRLNRNGVTTREVFSFREDRDISPAFNPPLRDRDTIIVNRTFFGQALDVVNDVLVPLSTVGSLLNNNYFWNSNNR
jgi:polysaccharide export outer membrane protein